MSDFITIQALSDELGLDRSTLYRYVKKRNFEIVKVRTPESRGQQIAAFTLDTAEAIRESRRSAGFSVQGKAQPVNSTDGFFYIIQLIPDLAPNRVKLGFTTDPQARLSAHRTAAPTAELIQTWPCKRCWERAAIDSLTRWGCTLISYEVFECDGLDALTARADAFFGLMPKL